MTREEATEEAKKVATSSGLRIAVTRNKYSENPEGNNFGFLPERAVKIFKYEEVLEIIEP